MRTDKEKKSIVELYSKAITVEDLLTQAEVDSLISIFQDSNKTIKNTGPITVNIDPDMVNNTPAIQKILSTTEEYIGKFEISAGLFFRVSYPHIIHNDDTWSFPKTYKGITVPLQLYGNGTGYPGLCIFDQYYLDGPAKFFLDEPEMELNYNKGVYEYSAVCAKTEEPFNERVYQKYLTHLKRRWLHGLSASQIVEWKPGNIMIFDSTKLHCATDFRTLGYNGKLGLSIFTKQI